MYDTPIFLAPYFQERLWGGNKLREVFGYEIPSEKTAECWAVSTHPNGNSLVKNGMLKGMTLSEVWNKYPSLLGKKKREKFPLLTKILDAKEDLSVQVHPDDAYAKQFESGELGKTECWYIIDCAPGAELLMGHFAKTKEELLEKMRSNQLETLLRRIPIKPGDFFYVPSGTLHALCSGTLVLETQQNSDATYRVYDYDRVGEDGKKRALHLDKAIDVIRVPHAPSPVVPKRALTQGFERLTYIENDYFSVEKWGFSDHIKVPFDKKSDFIICSVLAGEGTLYIGETPYPIKKSDHFIIPKPIASFYLAGSMEILSSNA